ncbi:hypothetical protein Tco_0115268 [Tanacetum coccineum]
MGKSTETLRLLTNEQKAFRDNLRKSGLGYNGPYVLSQAYAKIPKLYRAYELCDKNEQMYVFDYEDTLEDAEKSLLKMNEFQKDEKVQELKIIPIDYRKLNKLYDDFVPQKELSAEQTYFSSSFISFEKVSSEIKPSMSSMPSANPMLVDLNEMENVLKNLENDLDETFKQNELLKDQLLEASLAEDIKNLVITSCVEIRNKDLHDETERISKESKDVSNESKTADTVCNDAFEVTQELSKRIVELEKDLSKFEAKSIAFEIALQHKKIKFFKKKQLDISELNKESGKKQNLFENETSVFQIKIGELEKSLAKQIKENFDLLIKIDNLENIFADEEKRATLGKLNALIMKKQPNLRLILKNLKKRKLFLNDNWLERLMILKLKNRFLKEINHLRTQLENLKRKRVETKFDNSLIIGKPQLLNNERDRLLKQIASLESQLASQDIRSCQKEYHELRTSYNALKVKFDSLNQKKWNINVSKSSKPKESVSEKVHTGESSKPFLRRVSQFTTSSLQKDRKFFKKSQSFETFFPQKGFKTRASNAKNQSFETSHSCFTPVKQVWRPIKESQTFEASTSQKSFKTSTLKRKNQVFETSHSRFTPVKQVWRPKQSHLKTFKYSKLEMLSMQNKNDLALKNKNNGRFSNASKTNFQNDTSNGNNKWTFSSPTRFKTPHETPSFKNQWKIKRNFKSLLIPRELFSNETPVSSPRWNSTSLHRLDTTFNWFSKFGKPVSTVLKWVPKVRIYLKSQENSQKRANTDTRIRRVQKEAKESKPKPEKSSLSQIQSTMVNRNQPLQDKTSQQSNSSPSSS